MKRNAVHCRNCDTTIESIHRHDFVRCRCTDDDCAVWVDGGHDYHKRMFGDFCDYAEIDEEFVVEGPWFLEHTDIQLHNVHHSSRCKGEPCTIHNRTNHSKRSWAQAWHPVKGMQRVSPTSGRHYKDPDAP